MSLPFQPSLFDVGDPAPDESFSTLRRCQLDDDESWVDLVPAWMSGADTLFGELAGSTSWEQRERWMHHCSARWSPSCRWVVADASGCGRAAAGPAGGSPSTAATCS